MLKYFVISHPDDQVLVDAALLQIRTMRTYLTRVDTVDQADIVLVFVSSALIANEKVVEKILNLPPKNKLEVDLRIVPVLVQLCAWRIVLKNLSGKQAIPRHEKWLQEADNTQIDTLTYEIAVSVARLAGYREE